MFFRVVFRCIVAVVLDDIGGYNEAFTRRHTPPSRATARHSMINNIKERNIACGMITLDTFPQVKVIEVQPGESREYLVPVH